MPGACQSSCSASSGQKMETHSVLRKRTERLLMSASVEAAVMRLASAHGRLVVEGGRVNTKSEAGRTQHFPREAYASYQFYTHYLRFYYVICFFHYICVNFGRLDSTPALYSWSVSMLLSAQCIWMQRQGSGQALKAKCRILRGTGHRLRSTIGHFSQTRQALALRFGCQLHGLASRHATIV